jgi:predicted phosphodiesterase
VATITRKWRKFLACGCSHGHLADPKATAAILKFRQAWKPDQVWHLGDAVDLAAMRAGAQRDPDSGDRAQDMQDDLMAGLGFLQELEVTKYFLGNHEDRLHRLAHSPNAVVSYAAGAVLGHMGDAMRKLKAEIVPYAGLRPEACRQLGDTLFLHGSLYNMQAARDTAEALSSNCVFVHTHKVAVERARTQKPFTGYNAGCSVRLDVEYAKNNRSTLSWCHGFAWGEYSDNSCIVRLEQLSPHYRLPL